MSLITLDSLVPYVKPWGAKYFSSVKYSADLTCPGCGKVEKVKGDHQWFQAIIGFSRSQPIRDKGAIGILIFECPYCDTKFWSHLVPEGVWNCMSHCLIWPESMKHPDLRKK